MPVLNTAFKLANEPSMRPSEAQGLCSSKGDWLVFEGGGECLTLSQFWLSQERQQREQPVLIVECDTGEGKGPHVYEDVKIGYLAYPENQIEFCTNFGFLYLLPNKTEDESGQVITRIKTIRECFLMQEYLAFRQEQLKQQQAHFEAHL